MKISISLTICLIFLVFSLSAQKRSGSIHLGKSSKPDSEIIIQKNTIPERNELTIARSFPGQLKSATELIDTLNYPLEGAYALYVYPGGYVSGTNSWNDKTKVNVFDYGQPSVLKGVLIDFAEATSSNVNIEIAAWDDSGPQNSPGNKIASVSIPLDDIFIDVLNDQTTYIPFENPVAMTSTFYLGVVLPTSADTLALYTNTDGDTNPATAWEQWSDNQWYPYNDSASWGYNIAHAIFPIVDAEVGLIANFFGNATAVNPGTSIEFYDTSIGEPESWSWSFEGGNPNVSTEQNPIVEFTQEGLYDVQLIVGDGNTFDTLVREDYILVTEEIPVETDTLLFPLEGVRTLYMIIDYQGQHAGYICGNNLYNDLVKANYISTSEDMKITGILFDFAVATGTNQDIEVAIWSNNGTSGQPGWKVSSRMVEMNTIKSDVANNMMTHVPFDPPVLMDHPFYAGVFLPTTAGDSLALWSNEDGNTFPGIAWDKWEDGSWVPIAHPNNWGYNIAMGIHPIVEYQTGINDIRKVETLSVFPNPTQGRLTVDLSEFSNSKTIELVDITGNIIFSRELEAAQSSIELDLSEQYTGIYFVRIVSDKLSGIQKVIRY